MELSLVGGEWEGAGVELGGGGFGEPPSGTRQASYIAADVLADTLCLAVA